MSGRLEVQVAAERAARSGERFRLDVRFATDVGMTVVFGPSGAGKSTLLGVLLGELAARGSIRLAGETLLDDAAGVHVPIRRRRIGIVYQDALLFPHMTALQNVAFGLRRDGPGNEQAAETWLARLGGSNLARRRPGELSGGQRQRVALARALAARPRALLLDEPLSALDASARQGLGDVLIEVQRETGIPFIHVTHDPGEALRLGERMLLMDEGRVVQDGLPAEVLAAPVSAAAARVVGTENRFAGSIVAHHGTAGYTEVDLGGGVRIYTGLLPLPCDARVALGLRAEDVLLSLDRLERTSARNVLAGRVERVDAHPVRDGSLIVDVATPLRFRATVTPAAVEELALAPGIPVFLLVKASAFHRLL